MKAPNHAPRRETNRENVQGIDQNYVAKFGCGDWFYGVGIPESPIAQNSLLVYSSPEPTKIIHSILTRFLVCLCLCTAGKKRRGAIRYSRPISERGNPRSKPYKAPKNQTYAKTYSNTYTKTTKTKKTTKIINILDATFCNFSPPLVQNSFYSYYYKNYFYSSTLLAVITAIFSILYFWLGSILTCPPFASLIRCLLNLFLSLSAVA